MAVIRIDTAATARPTAASRLFGRTTEQRNELVPTEYHQKRVIALTAIPSPNVSLYGDDFNCHRSTKFTGNIGTTPTSVVSRS